MKEQFQTIPEELAGQNLEAVPEQEAAKMSSGETPEEVLSDKLLVAKLLGLVRNPRDREILTRYYIGGETDKKIEESMGLTGVQRLRTSAVIRLRHSDLARQVARWPFRRRGPEK